MNEVQEGNDSRVKLPIKTEIAAWMLIVIGIISTVGFVGLLLFAISYSIGSEMDAGPAVPHLVLYFSLPFCGIFTFTAGILLHLFKKRTWIVAVTVLVIAIMILLGTGLFIVIYHRDDLSHMIPVALLISFLIYLTPLILIILDKKNYFEMARQRELK